MKQASQHGTDEGSPHPHLALGIDEVCRESGLGRTTVYAAIKAGDLIARKYRRRTIVLADDLTAFLRGLPTTKSVVLHGAGEDA